MIGMKPRLVLKTRQKSEEMTFYITSNEFYSFYKPSQDFYKEIILDDMEDTPKNRNCISIILRSVGYRLI